MHWPSTSTTSTRTDRETSQPSALRLRAPTNRGCLQRQVREGANLAASEANQILNSHSKYHQPSLH